LDLNIPGIAIYETNRQIHLLHQNVWIITQTAFVQKGVSEKAITVVCNDYLSKPM
jgi:CheY-like chemotaxis protein